MENNLQPLIEELCQYSIGVTKPENNEFFRLINKKVPIKILKKKSGSEFNGWRVPSQWSVKRATISKGGKILIDTTNRTLGVAAHSQSYKGTLAWDDLKPHLITSKNHPDSCIFHCMWQYRPWDADWAICVPYNQYESMGNGTYTVDLETFEEPGDMLVAECHLPGALEETFVFNAHTCHPHQANDAMAGVAILIRLFQRLAKQKNHYSYRLILGPEHLGTVFYLAGLSDQDLNRLLGAVYAEMPGVDAPIKLASTFKGGHILDQALANATLGAGAEMVKVPWRKGAGNDETVWEAPGWEVPCVEMTRCKDLLDPYPQYHSEEDTAQNLDMDKVRQFADVLDNLIEILENNCVPVRKFDGLVCLSNPKYDLYMERPDPAVDKALSSDSEKWGYLLDCLLRYLDGSMSVLDIAERHNLPFAVVLDYLKKFEEKGLVRLVFKQEKRNAPLRAADLEALHE